MPVKSVIWPSGLRRHNRLDEHYRINDTRDLAGAVDSQRLAEIEIRMHPGQATRSHHHAARKGNGDGRGLLTVLVGLAKVAFSGTEMRSS